MSRGVYGFDPKKKALLYVSDHRFQHGRVRVNVGITNRTFQERYSLPELAIVERAYFIEGDGRYILDLEKYLHQELSDCLDSRGFGFKSKLGTRECFKADFDEVVEIALDVVA
jgi:hypothetical protein